MDHQVTAIHTRTTSSPCTANIISGPVLVLAASVELLAYLPASGGSLIILVLGLVVPKVDRLSRITRNQVAPRPKANRETVLLAQILNTANKAVPPGFVSAYLRSMNRCHV